MIGGQSPCLAIPHHILLSQYSFRLLSPNQIQEIVMDSDSNEKKYSASEGMEDDKSRPPSRRSSISQPPSPDFSASSSEDDDVGNVAGQQPQPCLWTLSPQPRRLFFHLLDLAIVNSYILLSSSGGKKISHRFSSPAYQRDAGMVWA